MGVWAEGPRNERVLGDGAPKGMDAAYLKRGGVSSVVSGAAAVGPGPNLVSETSRTQRSGCGNRPAVWGPGWCGLAAAPPCL
jgi:hypothetical protein